MRKLAAMLALAALSPLANAANLPHKMMLDKVVFQVSAKQWVTTQSALLTVSINATLTNADLVKARAEIMNNLNKIAAGQWQLTQFDRSQDSSGLEKLYVAAQARVPQGSLTDIYQNAKNVSKPGATYEINAVEFKPSLEETQQVRAQLRDYLYQQINGELNRLDKTYTNQNYSVHRIYFFEGDQAIPMAKAYQPRALNTMVMAAAATPAPALTVSNELIMNALVELASNRQEENPSANP
ncbi:hypothetical protein [Legionella micdadei]|uniref:DUF541 domain-containing protein n=1 Tax=Legionella micdadei TaxID=451 RepID=A0A098GIX2_LEGMI|nr:hypothetical protein [Legionella micdadei]ARG97120.1 hypothetical protein B6N58_05280 [Legionella micdadei]ARH00622.1 hypothetical protein B6V88_09420 [Legionella micdadei]KTD29285.1 hypothetical protein Lmic_1205 [Legionella micdadei]NSL17342.1 hypothetical protein [Legionella micdadei]CEG61441.1 conserved exported protein of unknown function [Legionella micdadei]